MKNLLVILLFVVGLPIQANAQPPHFDDLVILFADGQYEKLLKDAEKYTLKDNTKNEPIPYMFLARANFEMSKDAAFQNDYPKAFNDAIGFAGKCIKKDKEGLVQEEYAEFFIDLKVACAEDIINLVELQDFNKLRGSIMKLQRFNPDDVGSYFLMAASQYRIKDKGGAKITLQKANEMLAAIETTEGWHEVDFAMLRIGVIEYAKYLADFRMDQALKDILGKTKQWMENDKEYMAFYDQHIN